MANKSGDGLYRFLRRLLNITVWGGQLVEEARLSVDEPSVYVANHAGALGPIGVVCSVPLRLHPWVIGEMLERDLAGAYLLKDFVRPSLHLPDAVAAPFSQGLSRITVGLLQRIGCVPVWRDRNLLETYSMSQAYLEAGRSLLIFPEDPMEPIRSSTGLRPFQAGFPHLGELYARSTGRKLPFRPLAINKARCIVRVGAAVRYNPAAQPAAERKRIVEALESMIAGMLSEDGGPLAAQARASR